MRLEALLWRTLIQHITRACINLCDTSGLLYMQRFSYVLQYVSHMIHPLRIKYNTPSGTPIH